MGILVVKKKWVEDMSEEDSKFVLRGKKPYKDSRWFGDLVQLEGEIKLTFVEAIQTLYIGQGREFWSRIGSEDFTVTFRPSDQA